MSETPDFYGSGAMALPANDEQSRVAPQAAPQTTQEDDPYGGGQMTGSPLSTSYRQLPSRENGTGSVIGGIGHNLGLAIRSVIEGPTALPAQMLDVGTYPGRWLNRQFGVTTTAPSDLERKGLDAVGLPTAQTEEEKRNAAIIQGGAAMLTPMGLSILAPKLVGSLPAAVRPFVASPPPATPWGAAGQVVAGGVGAGLGEAGANWPNLPEALKPTARLLGNIVGAGGTAAAHEAAGTLVNAVRGIPTDIAAALTRLGIKPTTTGSVTSNKGLQTTEATFTPVPISGGRLQSRQQGMVTQFGDATERTASILGPEDTLSKAGTTVQDALRNWRENIFPAQQDAAWAPLNTRMAGTPVDPSGYRAALEYAASPPGLATLPENQRAFASAQAKKWLDALNSDAPPGTMLSWDQAQALKRRIGDVMGTPDIVSSIGSAQLKNIYGGLASDMRTTAMQKGQGGLFDAANQVTIDGHQFIDGTLSKAISTPNKTMESINPEQAAKSLLDSNTGLQQLRDRVPEAADALGAYKLRAMASAKPSATGETSTGSFTTAIRRQQQSQPEGTDALFGADPRVAQGVQDLHEVGEQFRDVEKNANASRTAAHNLLLGLAGALSTGMYTGGLRGLATAAAGSVGAPFIAGRFLTNPALIKLISAQQGASTPMRGRVAGLLGAQATMPQDHQGP